MKRNKRQYKVAHTPSPHKLIFLLKEYASVLALLIPIIPSAIYAGITSYQYGQCYFYNISLQSYLGLSQTSIIVQAILIIGIGIGIISLNVLGYIINLKNSLLALSLAAAFPVILCFFTIITAGTSDFEIVRIMLFLLFAITSTSLLPGIIIAFPDKKAFGKTHKNLLHDLWKNNKLFSGSLFISPLLVILFSIFFLTGYATSFSTTSLYFTKIEKKEYAVIYEGNNHYQLAATLQHEKTSKPEILLNMQMRIEKDNILIYPKNPKDFTLTYSNN